MSSDDEVNRLLEQLWELIQTSGVTEEELEVLILEAERELGFDNIPEWIIQRKPKVA